MTCYDCIHCGACSDAGDSGFSCLKEDVSKCKHFKNKADFVEVVRCRDCKYWRTEHGGFCEASNALSEVNNANNDFCSYGERKDT